MIFFSNEMSRQRKRSGDIPLLLMKNEELVNGERVNEKIKDFFW
jgi:hypothetical protein